MTLARVGSYATDLISAQQVLQQKQQLDTLLTQVTSGKIAPNYEGVAQVSGAALGYVAQNSAITNYQTDNQVVNVKLNTMQTTFASIQTTMTQFQQTLESYIDNSEQGNQADTQNLQEFAFQSMKNMEFYLNTDVGGQYLFGGSDTSQPPVELGTATLADFQSTYDGYNVSVPTSRTADLSTQATSPLDTGSLVFDDSAGTISSSKIGQLGNLPVGAAFTVSGSVDHDGTYTVMANDGTNVTVAHNLVAEGDPSAVPPTPSAVKITTSANAPQDAGVSLDSSVYFDQPNMITSADTGGFSGLQAGDSINIAGATNAANNGSFVVASVDSTGTYLTIQRPDLSADADNVTAATGDTSATVQYSTGTATTSLTDSGSGMTFTAASSGTPATVASTTLTNVPVGGYITIASAANSTNNGTYRVTANASGTLSLVSVGDSSLTTEDTAAEGLTPTISNNTATAFSPGTLAFSSAGSTISAATVGSLTGLAVGQTVNVAGTNDNNGPFMVTGLFNTSVVNETTTPSAVSIIDNGDASTAVTPAAALTFSGSPSTPTLAGNTSDLSQIAVGDVINVTGSASNNGGFVVTGVDSTTVPGTTTLTLAPPGTAIQVSKNESVSTQSYYLGNSSQQSQNVDTNTPLDFGVTAADPAFEKALRSMALVAQGQLGTAGGLDMNPDRLTQSDYLITSAIDNTAQGASPLGTKELPSNILDLQRTLDLQQSMMSTVTDHEQAAQTNAQNEVGTLLNADQTTTITELVQQQTALEASYQALSDVENTSLLKYLGTG